MARVRCRVVKRIGPIALVFGHRPRILESPGIGAGQASVSVSELPGGTEVASTRSRGAP
jgi:hypothetical protein